MNKPKLSEIDDQMIEAWKEKYGRVSITKIPLDEDDIDGEAATFYVRKPDRFVINASAKSAKQDNFDKANDILIKNCVLGGDVQYLDLNCETGDEDIYYSLTDELALMLQKRKAQTKKL